MAASLSEVLSVTWTTRVVSREAGANKFILRLFGMQPGGPAEAEKGHRRFGYDIFNDTRTVSQGRGPGTSAATVSRQKVGRVEGVFPRFYESLPLLSEELHNLRPIGGASNVYDQRGVKYILRQQKFMGQRVGNLRMLLLMGLMRGKMYCHGSGDDFYYDFTSANNNLTIDWQKPAGCLNQLNYDGTGPIIDLSWINQAANIPLHLRKLNAKVQQATGTTLNLIICPHDVWDAVLNNDAVQTQAGIANPAFTQQERVVGTDENGQPQTVIIGRIAAFPMVQWIITDEGLKIGPGGAETFVPYIPAGSFWWGPMPSTEYFEMLLGDEPVNEGHGKEETLKMGAAAWIKTVDDPSGRKLFTLDNCIPADYIPAASGLATCIF